MKDKGRTLEYYEKNHDAFVRTTADIAFSDIPDRFLRYLKQGDLILDLGCGSGRDSRYFLNKGFRVEAADGSAEMVRIAAENTGLPVRQMLFQDLAEADRYDGIFACASILHVPLAELPDIFDRMHKALKKDGILYVSFKYGLFEGEREGRYYTDLDEERMTSLLAGCVPFEMIDQWISADARPGRGDEKWLNCLLRKGMRDIK